MTVNLERDGVFAVQPRSIVENDPELHGRKSRVSALYRTLPCIDDDDQYRIPYEALHVHE